MLKKILILSLLLIGMSAYADETNIYEAQVEIEATGKNASFARQQALNEANRKALYIVTERICTTNSAQIFGHLNDNQILNFVREVSVISEKVTDSQYAATLKITINEAILTAYLQEKNVTFITPQSFSQKVYNKLSAIFKYENLREWISLQTQLKNIPDIQKMTIDSLGDGQAQLTLEFSGFFSDLQKVLATQNLILTEEDGFYLIERMPR